VATVRGAAPGFAGPTDPSVPMVQRDGIARAWAKFLATPPLVLSPTWTQLPFEAGFDVAAAAGTAATMERMRPVVPANPLDLPSACVPAGRDAATGPSIGVLLTGARFRDDLRLDAAEDIEARLGLPPPIEPVARARFAVGCTRARGSRSTPSARSLQAMPASAIGRAAELEPVPLWGRTRP
jgi:Amidase